METKQTSEIKPVNPPDKAKFLLVIPAELLGYYRQVAKIKGCFISSEMVRALEHWKTYKEPTK